MKSAVLHDIALAHYAIVYARAWAADSANARVRIAAENDRLQVERFILTLKNICTRVILVPLRSETFHRDL